MEEEKRTAEAKLFTLNEARAELLRQECATTGHSFDVLVLGSGEPNAIRCDRCGKTWVIRYDEERQS